MDNKNALQITAQYPAERYNLLVPMQTVAEIADIHKPVMNAVQISTNEADKEIYLQDKSKKNADGWALTKKGLPKAHYLMGTQTPGNTMQTQRNTGKCMTATTHSPAAARPHGRTTIRRREYTTSVETIGKW